MSIYLRIGKQHVKVGRRHKGVLLILIIDARKMHENGYEFFLSKNGVWLTDKVPTDYLTESRKLNND
jgi:putative RNA 2'-phosphotransferase